MATRRKCSSSLILLSVEEQIILGRIEATNLWSCFAVIVQTARWSKLKMEGDWRKRLLLQFLIRRRVEDWEWPVAYYLDQQSTKTSNFLLIGMLRASQDLNSIRRIWRLFDRTNKCWSIGSSAIITWISLLVPFRLNMKLLKIIRIVNTILDNVSWKWSRVWSNNARL